MAVTLWNLCESHPRSFRCINEVCRIGVTHFAENNFRRRRPQDEAGGRATISAAGHKAKVVGGKLECWSRAPVLGFPWLSECNAFIFEYFRHCFSRLPHSALMCFENSHCQFENTVEIFWDLESSNWSISPKANYWAISGSWKIFIIRGKIAMKIYFGNTIAINYFVKAMK